MTQVISKEHSLMSTFFFFFLSFPFLYFCMPFCLILETGFLSSNKPHSVVSILELFGILTA